MTEKVSAEEAPVAQPEPVKQLIEAANAAVSFLDAVVWNDDTAEREAEDLQHRLLDVLERIELLASVPVAPPAQEIERIYKCGYGQAVTDIKCGYVPHEDTAFETFLVDEAADSQAPVAVPPQEKQK